MSLSAWVAMSLGLIPGHRLCQYGVLWPGSVPKVQVILAFLVRPMISMAGI